MSKLIVLLFFIFLGCNQQPKKSLVEKIAADSAVKLNVKKPTVFTINQDSLKTYIPGKNSFPKPIINKTDHSNKVLLRGPRPIIPGESFLIQTKEDIALKKKPIKSKLPTKMQIVGSPVKNTPGTGDFENPLEIKISAPVEINIDSTKEFKKNIIKNKLYTIQNGDTILPPLQVLAKYLPSVLAKVPSTKDNSVLDTRYLDMAHGLSQSQVSSVVEMENGDIWISYRGSGLSRYDGISFTHYGLNQGLNDNLVNKIIKDRNGNIWIATGNNGVSKFDGQYFTWFTTDQGLPNNYISTILERDNGDIIFGSGKGISIYNGKTLANYNDKQGLTYDGIGVIGISEGSKGNIWISAGHLIKFDGYSFYTYSQKIILEAGPISSVIEDNEGDIWFGTFDSGIYQISGDSLINFGTPQGFTNSLKGNSDSFVTSIFEDKNKNIWITTYNKGIYKYDGISFTNYNTDHGLRNNTVYSITEDSGGNLWLSANGDGLCIFNPNSFVHFTTEQGLTNNWASKIMEDDNDNLWFASWGGGLYKFDGEFYTHYTTNEGILYDWVNEIITDKNNNIWVTAEYGFGGLSMFDQTNFTNHLIHEIIPGIRFKCAEIDTNGDLWFGTINHGILKLSYNSGYTKFTHYNHPLLNKYFISDLFIDKNENLWIGTYGGGIYIYNGIEFINYKQEQGLVDNHVTSFSSDAIGNVRIGTINGFSIYDGDTFQNLTSNEGLVHNYIRTVTDDTNGNHWVSTRGGISLLNEDYSPRYNFVLEDGLKDIDFKSNSGLLDSKNRLWWGTGKAITMLDLNNFKIPKGAPKLEMNEIIINQKNYDFRQLKKPDKDSLGINFTGVQAFTNIPTNLSLNYNNSLTFQYAGIDWNAPHQLKYQYRLKGETNIWSELTKESSISYRYLHQGNYAFEVKAVGATNEWSEVLEYSFVIHPPWWYTWWAKTIYILLFILLLVTLVQLRTKALWKKQKQLISEVENRTLELKKAQAQILESKKIKYQRQIKESEKKFRGVFNSMIDIFVRRDMEHIVTMISPSIAEVTGHAVEDIVGHDISKLFVDPKKPEWIRQYLLKHKGVQTFEFEIYKKIGTVMTISANAKLLYDAKGNPDGIESVFRDITKLKFAERNIKYNQQRLKGLAHELTITEEKTRKQIAIDLHDDVGQLISSSRMQLASLDFEDDPNLIKKKIKSVSQALLSASKSTRKVIFNLSPPQLNEIGLYAAIHDWMKEEVEKKYGIQTEIIGDNKIFKIEDDTRFLLFRSIRELLINILKHAQAKHVQVKIKYNNKSLEILVKDDGIGFNYDSNESKPSNKRFGLFSIEERVSNLGGNMTIISKPNFGSEIKLSIPIV